MPPKRKRNKSSSNKPQLTFIESPINKIHKLPSPVYASDHPALADVIPIDVTNVPWVSPQFHGARSAKKPRKGRTRRASHYDQPTKSPSPERTTTRLTRSRKYVPLQIEIEEQTQEKPAGGSTSKEVTDTGTPVCDPKGYRTRSKSRRSLPVGESGLDQNHEVNTDGKTPRRSITRTNSSKKVHPGLAQVTFNNSETSENSSRERGESSDKTSPGQTQLRRQKGKQKKAMRLNFDDCDRNNNGDTPLNSGNVRDVNATFSGPDLDVVDTPPASNALRTVQNITESARSDESPVTRRRGKSNKVNLFSKLLETGMECDCPKEENCPRILAYDTPESEYGKSMRWRQQNEDRKRSLAKKRIS